MSRRQWASHATTTEVAAGADGQHVGARYGEAADTFSVLPRPGSAADRFGDRRASANDGGAALKQLVSAGSAAFIGALAVATCAAAPEFIWQGLKIVATHLSSATLVSAALVALLLVFFVEPILERLRGWLSNAPETPRGARRHLAIAAAIGFFIALVSVGLHDAMATFTEGGEEGRNVGLERAVTVAISWGAVPFAIALAWQAITRRYLAILFGILAAASSFVAGWWFDWGLTTTLTTAIPCLLIQGVGYRRARTSTHDVSFERYAPTLAFVAVAWLLFSPAYDAIVDLVKGRWTPLYSAADYFVDVRFYIGWFVGLLLTRAPGGDATEEAEP